MKRSDPITSARIKYLDENLGFDYILETRPGREFAEIVTSCGGDVATYRVYGDQEDNFRIYAR